MPECGTKEDFDKLEYRKFGTPGIEYHIGDFMELNLSDLPAPDAVFIGGHGGKLTNVAENRPLFITGRVHCF